jgi:hypothetical protein
MSMASWHALAEVDNYHALQLLECLYTGQADCMYMGTITTKTIRFGYPVLKAS